LIPYRTAQEIIQSRGRLWDVYPDIPTSFESFSVQDVTVHNGVVSDENFDIITDSFLIKGQRQPQYYATQSVMRPPFLDFKTRCSTPGMIDKAYYNCGFYGEHYGHFLIDGMARFGDLMRDQMLAKSWLLQKHPCTLPFRNEPTVDWLKDVTPFKGHDWVSRTAAWQVGILYIHPPSAVDNLYMTQYHLDTCELYGNYVHQDYDDEFDKVYLSKHKWTDEQNAKQGQSIGNIIHGEKELVDHLKTRGWDIMCFEDLPISRQKHIILNSRVVAGCLGSQFHNVLLGKPRKDATFVYLHKPLETVCTNTAMIDIAKNLNSHYYQVQEYVEGQEHTTTKLNAAVAKIILDQY
jgi:capsular polysaccharide biosynthesis protein